MQTRLKQIAAFTLIELLIVITLITTIASIAVPAYFGASEQSKIVVANTTVKNIQKKIDEYYHLNGAWPTEIDRRWFVTKKYPASPFSPGFSGNTININDSPKKWHPGYKTLEIYPPFWYCRGNGSFRIRVPTQSTDEATLELYNAANMSDVSSLGDQSK